MKQEAVVNENMHTHLKDSNGDTRSGLQQVKRQGDHSRQSVSFAPARPANAALSRLVRNTRQSGSAVIPPDLALSAQTRRKIKGRPYHKRRQGIFFGKSVCSQPAMARIEFRRATLAITSTRYVATQDYARGHRTGASYS